MRNGLTNHVVHERLNRAQEYWDFEPVSKNRVGSVATHTTGRRPDAR